MLSERDGRRVCSNMPSELDRPYEALKLAFAGHLGGLAVGLVLGLAMAPRWVVRREVDIAAGALAVPDDASEVAVVLDATPAWQRVGAAALVGEPPRPSAEEAGSICTMKVSHPKPLTHCLQAPWSWASSQPACLCACKGHLLSVDRRGLHSRGQQRESYAMQLASSRRGSKSGSGVA